MDKINAWTNLVTSFSGTGEEKFTRKHPLELACNDRLDGLLSQYATALGISAIELEAFDGKTAVFQSERTFCDQDVIRTYDFSFSERQILPPKSSFIPEGMARSGNLEMQVKVRFFDELPNYIAEDNLETFALSICRNAYIDALWRRKANTEMGRRLIEARTSYFSSTSTKPGSQIVTTLNILHKYSGAVLSLYCSHYNGHFFVEYSSRKINSRAAIWKHLTIDFDFPSSVLSALKEQRTVVEAISSGRTIDHNWKSAINAMMRIPHKVPAIRLEEVASYHAGVFPIIHNNELLGAVVQIYKDYDPMFYEGILGLASGAAATYRRPSRWIAQERFSKVIADPIFESTDTRINEDQVFLIMPFGESWSNGVEQSVREILQTEGFNVLRADDMFGRNIMEDIWQGILKSRYVVCDTTGRNPNVYYELGICHTLGKDVILITQDSSDIPFDIRHLRHVVYVNSLEGSSKLKEGIRGFLQADRS